MLTTASGWNGSTLALSVMMVAGACNQHYLQLCRRSVTRVTSELSALIRGARNVTVC